MLFKGRKTEESIGNASMRTMAWAERAIPFLNPLAGKVAQSPGTLPFTFKGEVSGPHQNLDAATTGELGWLSRELPHVTRQLHIKQLPHRRLANREPVSKSVAFTETHSDGRKILLAPTQNINLTNELQGRQTEGRKSGTVAANALTGNRSERAPCIDVRKVADKVYNLMRHDLILERERATRLGG